MRANNTAVTRILCVLNMRPIHSAFKHIASLHLVPSTRLNHPHVSIMIRADKRLQSVTTSHLFLIGHTMRVTTGTERSRFRGRMTTNIIRTRHMLVRGNLAPGRTHRVSAFHIFKKIGNGCNANVRDVIRSNSH